MNYNNNYFVIDVTKFLMSLMVIAIHTKPFEGNIYNSVVNLAVPFFFIASAFFLGKKLYYEGEKKEKIIILDYFKKMVRLYIVWSIIYLPLAIYKYVKDGVHIAKALLEYIVDFLFVGAHFNSWQLWYLLATIWALVLVLFWNYYKWNYDWLIVVGVVISILISLIDYYDITTITNGRNLWGIVYFSIGIWISKKNYSLLFGGIMFCVSFVVNVLSENVFVNQYSLIFSAIGLFIISLNMPVYLADYGKKFRMFSTISYFIHMYVWTVICIVLYRNLVFGLKSFVMTIVITLCIAEVIVYLCKKSAKAQAVYNYLF